MKKQFVVAGVLICVAVGLALILWPRPNDRRAETVTIAINLPLTGGMASAVGLYPQGLQMGLEEQCQESALAPDLFSLDIQDNGGNATQAVSVMHKQLLTPFDVYVSGTSGMTAAVLPELDKMNKPHFLVAFDAFMTKPETNRVRILPNFRAEGPMWAEYAQRKSAKRVFMLSLVTSATEERFTKIVEPELTRLGIAFQRERFEFGTREFRVLAQKAKAYQPDLVFVSGYAVHIDAIVSALRSLGLIQDENVLCTMDFIDLLYTDKPREELVGVAFISPLLEVPGLVPEAEAWRQRFNARFGREPNYVTAYAYENGRLLARAYANRRKITVETLREALPYRGVVGDVALDTNNDLISTLVFAKVTKDGKVVQLNP